MSAVRIGAVVTILLLVIYHVLRFEATQCSGTQCDNYIWPSLALPIAVALAVAFTGWVALADARKNGPAWVVPLIATTALGVLGPVIAATMFRDRPDVVVAVATVLYLLTPVVALGYTFRESPSPLP